MINWKKYVDQIYCINYVTYPKKNLDRLYMELKRVDILDSDIYYEYENINTPIYEKIYKNFNYNEYKYNSGFDCTCAHYYCMKHAQQHNYKRILILENDLILLKDKEQIIKLLDAALTISNYDDNSMFVYNAIDSEMPYLTFELPINFNVNISENKNLYGAAFNIYNINAYNYFISKFENLEITCIDDYYNIYKDSNINIYSNSVNICIQQNWLLFTINSDILYNTNIDDDLNNLYKHKNIDALTSVLKNYKEVMNTISEEGITYSMQKYKDYLVKLFNYVNEHFYENKLNLEYFI